MDEENTPKNSAGADDDSYVIEDTGQSVDEIEHEMERTANEAMQEQTAAEPAADPADEKRQLHDRYLRTLADFENFRRRAEREKSDFHRYALTGLIKDLLPVLDNFDRALEHAEEGDDFHKGVLMIYKQLFDVLKRNGVRIIEETGVPFDPNIHEAVIREEDPSVPSHTVTAILQKGYFLHDRLLRPAMAKVAVGGPE
ncbi:MAG TPA: nucleotide exchange factor GrpE [Thermoanaerobaculia bacterium]|jgi:molecular chaperone GrpE|nr:nucleotide exchange factor GrpE [Thermoanaerobaculia bacterium]